MRIIKMNLLFTYALILFTTLTPFRLEIEENLKIMEENKFAYQETGANIHELNSTAPNQAEFSPTPTPDLVAENERLRSELGEYQELEEELMARRVFDKAKGQLTLWITVGGIIIFLSGLVGIKSLIDYAKGLADAKIKEISVDQVELALEQEGERQISVYMEKKQAEGTLAETEKKRGTLLFLTDELKTAEKRLKEKENEIKDYREKNMGGLPEQLQTNLTVLEKLQREAEWLNNGLKDLEMKRAALIMEIAASTTPKDSDDTVAYLNEQLSLLESKYPSIHPDIIRLKEILAVLEKAE